MEHLLPLQSRPQVEGKRKKTFSTGQTGRGVSVHVLVESRWHMQKRFFKKLLNEKLIIFYRGASKDMQ